MRPLRALFLSRLAVVMFAAALPSFGQPLTHSRWNPDVSGIFQCCPTDTVRINVVLVNDPSVPLLLGPQTFTVYINGVAQGGTNVNTDGTLALSDAGKLYQRTVSLGGLGGMDGQYAQFDGDFTYTVAVLDQQGHPPTNFAGITFTVHNTFVWDYRYSIFLPTLVTALYHTPFEFQREVRVFLNRLQPQDPEPQPPACPTSGGDSSPGGNSTPGGNSPPAGQTPPVNVPTRPKPCDQGMASYTFNAKQADLRISDTPVAYTPPHGQPMRFTLSYNHADTNQPSSFASSNLGPKWTFNWLTYISAGPLTGQTEAVRYLPGGGQERYQNIRPYSLNPGGGLNGSILISDPQTTDRSVLWVYMPTSGITPNRYERYLPDGSVETYDNNAGGSTTLYITKRVDPQGNVTTWNYAPASALLLSITDPLGQQTTFSYDDPANGLKITKVTDPFGRHADFTYDAQGRLKNITDPVGIVSTFGYQGSTDFINSLTTPYGTTTFSSQEGAGYRILQAADPLGQTERVEYQASLASVPSQETAIPSAPGLTVNNQNLNLYNSFYWDKQAYSTAVAAGAAPGTAASYAYARITHWALSPRGVTGSLSSEKAPLESRVWRNYQGQANPDYIDPSGTDRPNVAARLLDDGTTQLSRQAYNANGYVIQTIDPIGRETDYIYAPNGQDLIQTTQKNGVANEQLFSATYNSQHLPLTTTDAAGQATTYTYNAFGQPLTIKNARNETTTMVYNANGYLLSTTGAIPGSTTAFAYDSAGRVRTVTDSEGYTVTNDYDALDRLTKQTFPDGTFRQTLYDRLSVGSVTDRLNRTTQFTNDALGRVTKIVDSLNRIINQTWCACGALKTLQDAKGNTTTWNYDVQGRLISKVYADGKGDTFLYETRTSRLKSKTDALGQAITYGYAKDNNLVSITYPGGRNSTTPNVNFAYDAAYNRRTSMTDGTGITGYSYYPVNGQLGAGRLQNVAGPLANSTIAYTYDQLGRVVNRSINGAANQMNLAFDALGRVVSETNPLGTFSAGYVNTTSRPSILNYPNGQTTLYSYFDNVGDQRLKQIKNLSGATTLSQFDYNYDAEGQISTWGQQTSAANSYALGYDLAGQLTGAALTGATPKSFLYGYDPAGNRTNETINGVAAPVTVNALNELVTLGGSVARTFTYDANGNLTNNSGAKSAPDTAFQWDVESRMIGIDYNGNPHTDFVYDGLGRRTKIIEKQGGKTVTTRQFVWDGLSIAEERDGNNSVVKRFYAQGQLNGATPVFYTRDHLGSVRETANSAGSLLARYDYDPYGRRTLTSGTDVADFGFTGHFYHAQSKLHLAPYRAYDADTGRWISRDLMQEFGGINLYGYLGGRAVSQRDSLGLCVDPPMTPKDYYRNALEQARQNALREGNNLADWQLANEAWKLLKMQRTGTAAQDPVLANVEHYAWSKYTVAVDPPIIGRVDAALLAVGYNFAKAWAFTGDLLGAALPSSLGEWRPIATPLLSENGSTPTLPSLTSIYWGVRGALE